MTENEHGFALSLVKAFRMPTIESWEAYADENCNGRTFIGYIDAAEHMTKALRELLSETSSYEKLAKELTEFVKERESFISYANDHFP